MIKQEFDAGIFYNSDTFEAMKLIPDNSIDMVLADLPYGTTQNKWDTVIPFEPLWREYHRVAKERAAIVLTACQPFTTMLITSNIKFFKYSWVWHKTKPTGHLNAKKQPLRNTEDIPVFYRKQCTYNPQGILFTDKMVSRTNRGNYGEMSKTTRQTATGYPKTILDFATIDGLHPTQKPVALFEYLIKTYTKEGDLVLDNVAGSGTTAIAAMNTNRKWICIERDQEYYTKAIERIKQNDNI